MMSEACIDMDVFKDRYTLECLPACFGQNDMTVLARNDPTGVTPRNSAGSIGVLDEIDDALKRGSCSRKTPLNGSWNPADTGTLKVNLCEGIISCRPDRLYCRQYRRLASCYMLG